MRTPRTVELSITNRCNLECEYCSHDSSAGDVKKEFPKEKWLAFFEELNRCAVMEVTIGGGEPFYREDLKELIEGIIDNRMRFNILSNGTLITDVMADFLSSSGRCNGVQISIDGSDKTTHDSFRGNGNFAKTLAGIKILQEHDIMVDVRVTIHQKNVGDLEKIAEFLLEEIGLDGFSTNAASFLGRCRKNAERVQLYIDQRNVAMQTLLDLHQKYDGRIFAAAGPLAECTHWLEMIASQRNAREPLPGQGYLTGCGGPFKKMAVRADGIMVPCNQLSHIELGRIDQDDLKEVWQNHPELKRLRERRKIPLRDFKWCQGCDYIHYCTGNCPALAFTRVGDENHPSPDACLRQFLQEGGQLPGQSFIN